MKIDEELTQAMTGVDWNTLTMPQAQSFAVSLDMFIDAQDSVAQAKELANTSGWLARAMILVLAVAYFMGASAVVMLVGTVAMLLINVAYHRAILLMRRRLLFNHKHAVFDEIKALRGEVTEDDGGIEIDMSDLDEEQDPERPAATG